MKEAGSNLSITIRSCLRWREKPQPLWCCGEASTSIRIARCSIGEGQSLRPTPVRVCFRAACSYASRDYCWSGGSSEPAVGLSLLLVTSPAPVHHASRSNDIGGKA